MILVMKSLLAEVFRKTFSYLLLLTLFFVFIEIAFFILCNESYLYVFSFVANRMQLPLAIIPGVLYFAAAQVAIHIFFTTIVCVGAACLIKLWHIRPAQYLSFSMHVWFASVATILLANANYYPNSHFAQLITNFISVGVLTYILNIVIFSWIGIGIWIGVRLFTKSFLLTVAVVSLFSIWPFKNTEYMSGASAAKPNIIIVGVDSLRPDMIGYFGGEAKTPFINQLLMHSTVFSEALTPLARTYPSWVGILSGLYPIQTGVRTNLSGKGTLDLASTLPSILRREDYKTFYATDETRFSNIDKEFGFDEVVTPPIGLNDFLLGSFNDFPLSNLILNTSVGKWLFPYSYGNRPAFATYSPESFLNLLQPSILRSHAKPLFIAIHFCLPHHPYIYAQMQSEPLTGQQRYVQSIERADQQVQDFFSMLKRAHLLDHAIVILLSDHGEALELEGDRITINEAYLPKNKKPPVFYPQSDNKLAINQSAGHGTDVLGLPQYHSLLAFRYYGIGTQAEGIHPGIVSLLDIKPTILDKLKIKNSIYKKSEERKLTYNFPPFEEGGISLASIISGQRSSPTSRMLFIESDYSPEAVRSVYPNISKLVLEGANLFQIDPKTTRISVKDETVEMILKSKQYAAVTNDWMLAMYPQQNGTKIAVLINLKNGEWTTDLSQSFVKKSPMRSMLAALKGVGCAQSNPSKAPNF